MNRLFSQTTQAQQLDLHRVWLVLLAGSVVMVLVWTGWVTSSDDLVVSASTDNVDNVTAPLGSAQTSSQKAEAFDSNLAWSHLMKQCEFGPRVPGTKPHEACRDWIVEELEKSCGEGKIELQSFGPTYARRRKQMPMWNIIGSQNWEDAKVRVVLFAHWDTRPSADQEPDPVNQSKPILGANDGASGVAVLLELARVMKNQVPKDLGIQYVMTDGEDVGPTPEDMQRGARVYAKKLPRPKPDYGIVIDMIGDSDLQIPMEPTSMSYAGQLVRDFYAHADKIGLSKTFPRVVGPTLEDDHVPINRADLPIMDLIDFTYEPWHTLRDTPDKCSPQSLEKVGQMLQSWLLQNPVYRR